MFEKAVARTWFTYEDPKPEFNNGESRVDQALYVPLKDAIERYIRTGEIVEDVRRLHFHSDMIERLNDVEFVDPLMYRGYDRVDLELMHREEMKAIFEENAALAKAYAKSEDTKQSAEQTAEVKADASNMASVGDKSASDSKTSN